MEKDNLMPTQHYDVPYGWIRNWYVAILLVKLNVIWNQNWNAERVIVFSDCCFAALPPGVCLKKHTWTDILMS